MVRLITCFPHRARLVVLGSLLMVAISLPGHARLYKWFDADGEVVYSQTPPPARSGSGHKELNKRGIVVHEVERPLTAEERAELVRKQQTEARAVEAIRAEARKDRNLMATYPSLSSLDKARDQRLSTLDQQILYLNSRRSDASDRLEINLGRIGNFRRKKLKVPEQLVLEKINLDRQIESLGDRIVDLERDRTAITSEFDSDRERYLRILSERSRSTPGY